jgi:3-oxoacyl-[acyl-carrier protein] reductase
VSKEGQPRVAIVTGGSGGIGRQTVERLSRDGVAVVVNYAGSSDAASEAVHAVAKAGGQAIAVQADVADADAVKALFDEAERAFGGVDILVNSAGRMDLQPLADFDLAVFDEMLRVNVRGTFVTNQQAAWRLRAGGSIVNFSSTVIALAIPSYTGYCASKGAVEAMTLTLASELRGRDVTVNAIAPGPTATKLWYQGKSEAEIEATTTRPPLQRLGQPEDIAEVVAFLVSPAGHWINGQVVRANGGIA